MTKNIFKSLSFMSLFLVFLMPTPTLANSAVCAMFQLLYEQGYEDFLRTGGDIDSLTQTFDRTCMSISPSSRTLCYEVRDNYYDVMLTLIFQDTPVQEAAETAGACTFSPTSCPAGQAISAGKCVTCPTNFYKEGTATGPCVLCPENGETLNSTAASYHDSITDCYILGGSDASGTFNFNNTRCNYTK